MNAVPTSCSSGRLRSTAARRAAGVATAAPTGVGLAERPGSYRGAVEPAPGGGGTRASGPLPATPASSAQRKQLVRRNAADGAPTPFGLTPYSSNTRNISASPARAASRSGDGSLASQRDGSAPYSSSCRNAGAAPTMPLVMTSGDRRSSERAFASAPPSSRTRILTASGAAHMSAVAPAPFAALGSVPASSSRVSSAASPYRAAVISGVE